MSAPPPLRIRGLSVGYPSDHGPVQAVREVEITVHKPHAPLSESLRDVTVTIRRSRA